MKLAGDNIFFNLLFIELYFGAFTGGPDGPAGVGCVSDANSVSNSSNNFTNSFPLTSCSLESSPMCISPEPANKLKSLSVVTMFILSPVVISIPSALSIYIPLSDINP